ncbi:hypothetical protein P5673_026766 [Acropora cervicornis]|uniref:Uncharacterized protein n=1 Tax=Acropora cervicornis TaxID=6130 RepID=A0AAD9Q034_ACRCE|nr:hypothetical protein P5673_026766 [Acropora cervicornis]
MAAALLGTASNNFWEAKQKDGETLDSFHTRLRNLVKSCDFGIPDKEIKEQIISNCQSNSLPDKALREDLDLAGLMKAGRALKLIERQAKHDGKDEKCRNCGETYSHKDSCSTKNRKCCTCGKLNHFACICRANPAELAKHVTYQDPRKEAEYVYTVGHDKQPMCKVMIDRKEVAPFNHIWRSRRMGLPFRNLYCPFYILA